MMDQPRRVPSARIKINLTRMSLTISAPLVSCDTRQQDFALIDVGLFSWLSDSNSAVDGSPNGSPIHFPQCQARERDSPMRDIHLRP